MGLRCSLLGHDFGEPEVEREREERGSEVVLTVREVAECGRCGKTNVVSENKEVTALPDADGEDADRPDDTEQTSLSDATPESSTGEASGADEDVEDDAIIIGDDEDGDDANDGRAHGEWPEPDRPAEEDDEDEDADDGPTEWPTIESEDEGFDAQPSPGGSAAVEFGGGLAPERTDVEEEEGVEYVESVEPASATAEVADADGGVQVDADEADSGFAKVGEAPSPTEPGGGDVDSEFVCPQCDFVDDTIGSSLRAGDVCPECRKGYLTEQERSA